MPEQSDIQGNEEGEAAVSSEVEVSTPEEKAPLTLDEALEVAIEHHEGSKEAKPTKVEEAAAAPEEEKEEEIEAPSEFNAQEKEAWKNGDRRGIASAWQRINTSRLTRINHLETENQRYKSTPQQTKSEDDPNARVVAAIKANPVAAIHQILKVKGLTPEQVFSQEAQQSLQQQDHLTAFQSEIAELKSWKQQQEIAQIGQQFGQVFDNLQGAKNAAGEPVYPDLTEDEAGYRLANAIGSLATSPQLQAAVRFRNPGAGLLDFSREAYKLLGGRVLETNNNPPRSQESTQKHINQAKRARISTPGKAPGTLRSVTAEKKYATTEGAIERALELLED